MTQALIYRDGWSPSRPWRADLKYDNGQTMVWAYGFKTLKALTLHIETVCPRVVQTRREDMDK